MAHSALKCGFRTISAVLLILTGSTALFSQNGSPQSNPQAIAFAQQSIAALTNGSAISDVTLNANVTWIAGSDNETGSATLQAKGTGESLVQLNLTGSNHTYIRNDVAAAYPQGESVENGNTEPAAMHNCWTSASWFFPQLSFLASTSDPSLIFSYIGQETRGSNTVQHLQVYRFLSQQSQAFASLTQTVSTTDFYLDSNSLLPVSISFNTHPDDDANTNIALEIDYSNYQLQSGVLVPLHVQKFVSGGLALDVVVTSATLNSGLSDTLFAIPQ